MLRNNSTHNRHRLLTTLERDAVLIVRQDRSGQDRTVFYLSSLNGALPVPYLRTSFKDDSWFPANLAFSEAEFSYLRIFQ